MVCLTYDLVFVNDRNSQDTRVTLPPGAEAVADNEGCFFYLAGVNDYESDPQYDAALNGRDESVATVLLAHEPIQVRAEGARGGERKREREGKRRGEREREREKKRREGDTIQY